MLIDILSVENKPLGKIDLNEGIFDVELRQDLIARVIHWQLAKRRSGNHKTKGVSEISGTTRKPYRQKGTGRARQGSLRSAQFRGGATIFGPVVRSHEYSLPKKIRKLALKSALSEKLREKKLIVVDFKTLNTAKAKELFRVVTDLGLKNALVIEGDDRNINLNRATSNLPHMDVLPQIGSNVYDIVRRDILVLTPEAISLLEARLK